MAGHPETAPLRPRWGGLSVSLDLGHRGALCLGFALVMGPFLVLWYHLGLAVGSGQADWLWLAVPLGRRWLLLVRSVGLAVGVAGVGTALGVLAALVLWRWHRGVLAYLRWLPLMLLPVPFCVQALAWWTLADAVNFLLAWLGLGAIPFQGGLAAWWVQVMALLPLAVGLALVGLETVDPKLIEAARLSRGDVVVFRRIILPLAAPKILAGAGFLFLLSITDYSVPSLFQYQVYALEIFAEFSASHEPARALALSLPLLLVTGAVVAAAIAGLRDSLQPPAWTITAWERPPVWPRYFRAGQYGALGLLLGQLALLLLGLGLSAGGGSRMVDTVWSAAPEITYSLWVAGLSTLLGLAPALAVARELNQDKAARLFWWLLIAATLALPAPLVGIGLIALNSSPWFPWFMVEAGLMPVWADLSRFIPWVALVLLVQVKSQDPLWFEAARILQTSRWQTWRQVTLPILAPGLLAGAGLGFMLSLGELGATLLVAPPGQATLVMRIYNYLHYGAADTVAGLCLVLALTVLVAGCGAALTLAAWFRLLPKHHRLRI